jgi:hypothetical protein
MMGGVGLNNLIPDEPKPLTAAQMQVNAKRKQTSNICNKKKKTKTVKEMCNRWETRNA